MADLMEERGMRLGQELDGDFGFQDIRLDVQHMSLLATNSTGAFRRTAKLQPNSSVHRPPRYQSRLQVCAYWLAHRIGATASLDVSRERVIPPKPCLFTQYCRP